MLGNVGSSPVGTHIISSILGIKGHADDVRGNHGLSWKSCQVKQLTIMVPRYKPLIGRELLKSEKFT